MAKFGSSYSICSKYYGDFQHKCFTYSNTQIQDKLSYKNYLKLLCYLAEHRPVLSEDSFITSLSVETCQENTILSLFHNNFE